MGTWTLTDPATLQYVRHIRNNVYEFMDSWISSEAYGIVWKRLVDLDSYLEGENFVATYLHPYGYKDVEDVVSQYGEDANKVLVECIGETDDWLQEWIIFTGVEDACEDFVHSRIERDMRDQIYDLETQLCRANREKEQAISDLSAIAAQYGSCFGCKNRPDKESPTFCRHYGKCSATPGSQYGDHWEWRGAKED